MLAKTTKPKFPIIVDNIVDNIVDFLTKLSIYIIIFNNLHYKKTKYFKIKKLLELISTQ